MHRSSGAKWALIAFVVVAIAGCATLREGQQKTLETSHDRRPSWLTRTPRDSDNVYFVGTRTEARRIEDGEKDARMSARAEAAEAIETRILDVYEAARAETGISDENYGTAIRDAIIARAKGIVRGGNEREMYWEKLETMRNGEIRYLYNVSVLIAVPKEDLRSSLLQELRNQARERVTEGDKTAQEFLRNAEEEFDETTFE